MRLLVAAVDLHSDIPKAEVHSNPVSKGVGNLLQTKMRLPYMSPQQVLCFIGRIPYLGRMMVNSRTMSYKQMSLFLYTSFLHDSYMKYRSRTDIVAQVLEAANGGATKTRIMYSAYLSYAQLKEYLSILTENDLLEYDETERKYRTSEKGMKFIRIQQSLDQLGGPLKVES